LGEYGKDDASSDLDLTDEASIRAFAQVFKKRNLNCWRHPDFHLTSGSVNNAKNYHFLEYSGTRQLAEDIERVRILFGRQKISLFGCSYGTTVVGTYSTIFPHHVHLVVLDGSTLPFPDVHENSEDRARSANQRIDYFTVSSCEFVEGTCGVNDMRGCLKDLDNIIQSNKEVIQKQYGASPTAAFMMVIDTLFDHVDKVANVCSAAKSEDFAAIAKELAGNGFVEELTLQLNGINNGIALVDRESKPTADYDSSPSANPDWPFEGHKRLARQIIGEGALIFGQDMALGSYNEDLFVKTAMDWNDRYPGASTQRPAKKAVRYYGSAYFWPKSTPLPPMGSSIVTGIIAGQMYDYATPYIWTLKMRQNFPQAYLLTSRSANHGMNSAGDDKACLENIQRYFEGGHVDFVDGFVCDVRLLYSFHSLD